MSDACCARAPVIETGYTEKGSFGPFAGLDNIKTYTVGPDDAKQVIILIYDAFGFCSQIQQGADIISSRLGAKVIMPDFFRGQAQEEKNFPPKTDEAKAALQDWFKSVAAFDKHIPSVLKIARDIKAKSPGTKVGVLGLCWGGKVAVLSGTEGTPLDAVASVHPGRVEESDAQNIVVPLGFFPTKDEDRELCDKVAEIASQKPFADKNKYIYYETVHHGFAGARADLSDPENKEKYGHFYNTVSDFFKRAFEA
ncbi:hypothetical protein BOTBODRAFT_26459 [Botryobasidium botryosum FD-172 SS1]|uniref:Dienelactone hydrolase domain-containing protein n=1 Tax=Botryobasidium botryosum (strain FD-172 SS1) TaxID=930990 RepID=A0A067N9K3_BOTB1|nr:hypothetical protein BOTBODRAFT_26459 [Botryobasidium botryosum FD-172 SS1]